MQSGRKQEKLEVKAYIEGFKWNNVNYQMDKSLKLLGQKIVATQKTCDDRLKKVSDELNIVKMKMGQLQKKDTPSLMQKDLGDVIYENKIPKANFVNVHVEGKTNMTTVLVVVPKKKVE